ncbi:MAG TPA: methyltransferase, partial [Thermoanaerobaculia bacterium]|nr:methyltransferase [Thermoanaerobaculia bacterium]
MSRRIAGEPLQYIRGRADFYGREFYVDHRVLIPRPETELLVERVLQIAPRGARIVDVGAGSGCIAVTLKLERDDLDVVAVDLSLGALAVAKRNR